MSAPQSRGFLRRLPSARPRLVPRARLQVDKVSGKPVLLYPEGVVVLNETGEVILRLCDGTRLFPEIIDQLSRSYRATVDVLTDDVSAYLFGLHQRSLIELSEPDEELIKQNARRK